MRNLTFFLSVAAKTALAAVAFASLNAIDLFAPYSAALLVGLLYSKKNAFGLLVPYIIAFAVFNNFAYFASGAVQAAFLCAVFSLYRSKERLPKIEIILYFLISMLPFIFWGSGNMLVRLVYSSVICLISFVATTAVSLFFTLYEKRSPPIYELSAATVIFIGLFVGFINLFGANVYRFISALALLYLIRVVGNSKGAVFAGIFAAPLALTACGTEIFAVYFIWYALAAVASGHHRLVSAIAVLFAEAFCIYLLNLYPTYGLGEALSLFIAAAFFGFLPLAEFTENITKDKPSPRGMLVLNAVNRNRQILSSRLYEISAAFFQLNASLSELEKNTASPDYLISKITDSLICGVCKSCAMCERCSRSGLNKAELIDKTVALGINKKKISLIDLPREFTEICAYPNSVIFELNRLIAQHSPKLEGALEVSGNNKLLSLQAQGLADVMKKMAFDFSKSMANFEKTEREYTSELKKRGIATQGVMLFGEGSQKEICVFCNNNQLASAKLADALSELCEMPLSLAKKTPVSDKCSVAVYRKTPKLDAAFGASFVTKKGSSHSGDKHSLVRLDEGRFLVALSDGMGSGATASSTSSGALGLIEAFYRAGLDSEVILNTVNRTLSMSNEDNFTALDLGVVNLYTCQADFIKIGAPFGFVASKSGVKYIEGSSLPLGILEEFTPSGATLEVNGGDVIIMFSDGVSDAFGSSTGVIDFLKSAPLNNPQQLSDELVKRALEINGGEALDDMTAVCVRLFERLPKAV